MGDEGMSHLRRLCNLRRLGLAGTDVTSASGPLLAGLVNLEALDLQRCSIDDAGMHLQKSQQGLRLLLRPGLICKDIVDFCSTFCRTHLQLNLRLVLQGW